MAFNVNFYTFTKKSNSTARPSGGTTFSCNIKTDSGVVNPRIELNYSGNPSEWNYCYIPHFGRYYYITEWTYTPGLWVTTCQTDVMASYKTEIGNRSLYVLRASADYDGNIFDTMYPPCLPITSNTQVFKLSGWADPSDVDGGLSGGSFVVGIVGSRNNSQYGSTSYYVFSFGEMKALFKWLFQDAPQVGKTNAIDNIVNSYNPSLSDSVNTGFSLVNVFEYYHKVNVNPIQYIASCMFFPYSVPTGGSETVYFGFYDSGITARVLGAPWVTRQTTIALPAHPSSAARGNYLNLSPYTRRWLTSPVFGDIELDTSLIGSSGKNILVTTWIDHITGGATMQIVGSNDSGVLAMRSGQIGVSIAVAQAYRNIAGVASAVSGAPAAAAQAAAGVTTNPAGIVGGVASAISAIDSIDKAIQPHVSMIGANGGMSSSLRMQYTLFSTFNTVPAEDNANRGRPLMQKRTPASLGGYLLISDGAVPIPGTAGEQREVKNILESGFYYE